MGKAKKSWKDPGKVIPEDPSYPLFFWNQDFRVGLWVCSLEPLVILAINPKHDLSGTGI